MRLAVIGLGSMGRRRLRNLTHLGVTDLVGMEVRESRAAEVGAEFGIPVFGTPEEVLDWGPDAFIISTPPDQHTSYALAAARAGLAFFTEASVVLEGMDELAEEVARQGTVAAPSCTMRFHPAVGVLREHLAAGTVGRPLAVTHHSGLYLPDWHPWEDYRSFYVAQRHMGAAREIVPFELNWLVHLFGDVDAITGIRAKVSDLETDSDDVYVAAMQFTNGVVGSLVVDALARPGNRAARVICSEGTLVWDSKEKVVREYRAESGEWTEYSDPPLIKGPGAEWQPEDMYIDEMSAFMAAVAGKQPFPFTLDEDMRLLRLTYAIEDSSDRALAARV